MSNINALVAEKAYLLDCLVNKFPTGIVSYPADSYDFYGVLDKVLPTIKNEIISREGKFVVRGDSGNPVDVICGDEMGLTEVERKGTIEHLWDVFGGTINDQGYKVLDSHIGMIYGDGITVQRSKEILSKLKAKGFASTNIVFGVGSYSLNMISRDHLGMAIKATNAIVDVNGNDVDKPIYKDPKTDSTKKSARGLLSVHRGSDGKYTMKDVQSRYEESTGELSVCYMNGQFHKLTNIFEIRERMWNK